MRQTVATAATVTSCSTLGGTTLAQIQQTIEASKSKIHHKNVNGARQLAALVVHPNKTTHRPPPRICLLS